MKSTAKTAITAIAFTIEIKAISIQKIIIAATTMVLLPKFDTSL